MFVYQKWNEEKVRIAHHVLFEKSLVIIERSMNNRIEFVKQIYCAGVGVLIEAKKGGSSSIGNEQKYTKNINGKYEYFNNLFYAKVKNKSRALMCFVFSFDL